MLGDVLMLAHRPAEAAAAYTRAADLRFDQPVLLRLVDRDGKIVPPMVFIPSAERHNMMQAIDHWVIANALPAIRRLALWHWPPAWPCAKPCCATPVPAPKLS